MRKIGVFIVGTSPAPVYISIKNYLKDEVEKIYLLATEDNQYSKGTDIYAKRLAEAFHGNNIEIIYIDRSNMKIIDGKVDSIVKEINSSSEEVELYLDFTGGTKIQSAFIRDRFNNDISTNNKIINIYVDGYTKRIVVTEANKSYTIDFDEIGGHDDDEMISEILRLHGFQMNKEEDYVKFTSLDKKSIYKFDDIYMYQYILEFEKVMENTIKDKDKDKGKAKLEMFENVIASEEVGGDFSILNLKVPEGTEEKHGNLMNEFLGIKRDVYNGRIFFNDESC